MITLSTVLFYKLLPFEWRTISHFPFPPEGDMLHLESVLSPISLMY